MFISRRKRSSPGRPGACPHAPALGKADITTATDYNPFGMLMPGRIVEDNSVQCIPVSKTRLVNQIDYLDDMVNPDAPAQPDQL
jgi:hypothetical protein